MAASAVDDAGEEEVAALPDATGAVLAAPLEQRAGPRERVSVDERFVAAVEGLFAPVDAADVGLVGEDRQHLRRQPRSAARRHAFDGELTCDRHGPEPAGGVKVEDPSDDRRLTLVRDQVLVSGARVAVRDPAIGPVALLGAPLDAGGDAVHDRRVLELGEDAEHLQHHPPRRRPSVKRLRGGFEDYVEPVEFFGELSKLTHLP